MLDYYSYILLGIQKYTLKVFPPQNSLFTEIFFIAIAVNVR
jgi:hypothetical protein